MEVEQEFGDQVNFVGVPGLAGVDDMRVFLETTDTGHLNHIIDDGAVWERFGVTGQRTYVFLNDDGEFRVSGYGSLREDVEGLIAS